MKEIEFESVTTRGGDEGKTTMFDGSRIMKNAPIIKFIGNLDRYSAIISQAKIVDNNKVKDFIGEVQNTLWYFMGICSGSQGDFFETEVSSLEVFQKYVISRVSIPNGFVNFGYNEDSIILNIIRTETRALEIEVVDMITEHGKSYDDNFKIFQKYINRLSDVFYVLALWSEDGFRDRGIKRSIFGR